MQNYDHLLSLIGADQRSKIAKAGKKGPALFIRIAISNGLIRKAAHLIDVQTAATAGKSEAGRRTAAVAALERIASYSDTPTEMAMEFAKKYGIRDPRPGMEVSLTIFGNLTAACADFMQTQGQEVLDVALMQMTRAQTLLRKSRA